MGTTIACIGSVSASGNMECLSRVNSMPSDITGHVCKCSCKRMFLTHEKFSNICFPILAILGLYCLLDAVLTQCFKDKDKSKKDDERYSRWPVYKLAEQYPKKYNKVDQKRAEEERKIVDQENIPLQPSSSIRADLGQA